MSDDKNQSSKEQFDQAMFRPIDALVSVFFRKRGTETVEHIGSAVLLQLKEKLFLLSAAHVTDYSVDGELLMPIGATIESILGGLASIGKPDRRFMRQDDPYDVSYILLDKEMYGDISKTYKPILEEECWAFDNHQPEDIYSVSGYPLNKTKNRHGIIKGEAFTYTGEAAIKRKYKILRYDPINNIIINFRLKKASDMLTGIKNVAPHPRGASGGAILRWPKSQEGIETGIKTGAMRKLCGVIHTYKRQHNCMIGTKLGVYLSWIYQNNPELAPVQEEIQTDVETIPMVIGLIFYKKDDWDKMKAHAVDSETMCNSWEEWRDGFENGIEHMQKSGKQVMPVEITSKDMHEYCAKNKVPNNSKSRIALCNRRAYELMKENKII